MFIQRNYDRTENDDFKLNVEMHLNDKYKVAVPVTDEKGVVVGWQIKASRFE